MKVLAVLSSTLTLKTDDPLGTKDDCGGSEMAALSLPLYGLCFLMLLAQNERLRGPALSGNGICHVLAEAKAVLREVALALGESLAGVHIECRHFKTRL